MKTKQPKIIPRGSWVLVRPEEVATENAHGLTIPESVEKEQKARGTVVRVGNLVKDLKTGMTVIYGMYAGEDIQFRDKAEQKDKVDLKLLLDEDILAVIEDLS